jgi:hypothetical protein
MNENVLADYTLITIQSQPLAFSKLLLKVLGTKQYKIDFFLLTESIALEFPVLIIIT